mgnify:CR=1 FL=1
MYIKVYVYAGSLKKKGDDLFVVTTVRRPRSDKNALLGGFFAGLSVFFEIGLEVRYPRTLHCAVAHSTEDSCATL